MESTSFMKVDEVAQELGVSKSYAYKIVQKLNEELKSKGILVASLFPQIFYLFLAVVLQIFLVPPAAVRLISHSLNVLIRKRNVVFN